MDIKKRMGIYTLIFLTILSFLTYLSKNSDNYIKISNNRESIDFFNKNQEEIFLYKNEDKNLEKIKLDSYLDGYASFNTKGKNYILEVQEKKFLTEKYHLKKEKEPIELFLNYLPKSNLRQNNIFLNSLTVIFLIYNFMLFYNFKKEILSKKELFFPIFFVCLKIILTNTTVFSNIFLIRLNALVSSILGLYLLLYVKSIKDELKDDFVLNIGLWILFLMYYLGEVIVVSSILNIKILNYLVVNYLYFLKIVIFFYIWIDALIIILIMFFLSSLKIKKKQIIKEIEKKNLIMIGSFIVLSLIVELFINNSKYFYYLNMFEFVFIFWYIFLTNINTIGKIDILTLKIFQMFLHIYLFFIITENVWLSLGIIFSFLTLNMCTHFIKGTLRVDKYYIENLVNRMYLTKNYKEFKEQLSKELKKNLELIDVETKILIKREDYKKFLVDRNYDESEILLEKGDILNKKYDYAVRLKYSKNPFLALILIENKNIKLVYVEKRYLEEISEKISLVASRYRIEKLQEELN